MGVQRVLIVSHHETAKECLTIKDKAFYTRPSTLTLSYNHAMFGFDPYADQWRQMQLYQLWDGKKDGSDNVLVDMKNLFENTTLNMILRLIVGKRILSSEKHEVDTINKATYLGLIITASDTTTVTLTRALSLLLNNKVELKRLQQEVDIHVGKDRLVYLKVIIKETLRLYPVGLLSVPYKSMEGCTVSGYHIPAGTRLLVNLSKVHRDPRVWSDPCDFRPQMFLTTHKDKDFKWGNMELILFSSGRRMCPGVSLAVQVLELVVASVVQGFELKTPLGEAVDMTEGIGLTNLKATPLQLLITPRLPSS
ncbi:Cytochrome P450 82C3 [Hibiscus syriacus]|uniref:Cytochrome P450 82C3 n=1 Tax=Hibiscus syriacus TaxID=106335 RepID=A0A6A2WD83_HIBSY|nr:Cytochrome P450 82C3 [Hibiscus syriacus]